ncbi:hypothetical protein RB601_003763 [Gaeumannomyces tritici]
MAPALGPHQDSNVSDRPQNEEDAKKHIAQIQKALSESGDQAIRIMESMIGLLANTLSTKPAQFLLELLQNADDNAYADSVNPELVITFTDETLQFDTNELGFRRQDVQSICSMGQSSKKEPKKQEGKAASCIGEKGIGFKAVFRVAEQVFIHSGHYSFQFDSRRELGCIKPEWAVFPGKPRMGWTSIHLKLKPDLNREQLLEEMGKFDATFLLFLKRIRVIRVQIKPLYSWLSYKSLNRTIRRLDDASGLGGLAMLSLTPSTFPGYVVNHYTVRNMPPAPERPSCAESEIVLAFPKAPQQQTKAAGFPGEHKVYAFLPIRSYGFKADFLLPASREDIMLDSDWNRALREAIPPAVVDFIPKLRAVPELRYQWPRFFPVRHDMDDFFHGLSTIIANQVAGEQWVEQESSKPRLPGRPLDLRLVPEEYAVANDKVTGCLLRPIIPVDLSLFAYPSSMYPIESWDGLAYLGMKVLSAAGFLEDLSNLVRKHTSRFQSMPRPWQSRLAEILSPLVDKHQGLIFSLPLILTQQNTWVAPQDGPLFLPSKSGCAAMPWGLMVGSMVHADATEDTARKALLLRCGTTPMEDKATMCRAVTNAHAHNTLGFDNPNKVPLVHLIGHTKFLREQSWVLKGGAKYLWVETEGGRRLRSAEVYLDSENPLSASEVFQKHRGGRFPFLHPAYQDAFPSKADQGWLMHNLSLSTIPRLVQPYHSPDNFEISPDFLFLVQEFPALEVLQLLKTHWTEYEPWINPTYRPRRGPSGPWPASAYKRLRLHVARWHLLVRSATPLEGTPPHDRLRGHISSMKVPCWGGLLAPLGQTYLPRKNVLAVLDPQGKGRGRFQFWGARPSRQNSTETRVERMLDVPDPEAKKWDILQHFGVVVEIGAPAIVEALDQVRRCVGEGAIKEHIVNLYKALQAALEKAQASELDAVKLAFSSRQLVFVPAPTPRWLKAGRCVWDGPSVLQQSAVLKKWYGELRHFFFTMLGIGNANLETVVAEVKALTAHTGGELARIDGLLELLADPPGSQQLHAKLDGLPIFPLWTGKRNAERFDRLSAGGILSRNNEWYIADAPGYLEGFEGKIPLLALAPHLGPVEKLLHLLNCGDRKLSELVGTKFFSAEKAILDRKHSTHLRGKWKCIARLIPRSRPDRESDIRELNRVLVYRADVVSAMRTLRKPWCKDETEVVEGHAISVSAAVATNPGSTRSDGLRIYIANNRPGPGHLPLEVHHQLAKLYGIKSPNSLAHLCRVLSMDDVEALEGELDLAGIPNDFADIREPLAGVDGTIPLPPHHGRGKEEERDTAELPATHSTVGDGTLDNNPQPTGASWGSIRPGKRATQPPHHGRGKEEERDATELPATHSTVGDGALDNNPQPTGASWGSIRPGKRATMGLGREGIRLTGLKIPLPSYGSCWRKEEEAQGIAEFSVNIFFSRTLGDAYNALDHWTSNARSKYWHKSFHSRDADVSSFTIHDKRGLLKSYFEKHDCDKMKSLAIPDPTFHVQVVFTSDPGNPCFQIETKQVQKAEKICLSDREVFVLALVTDLDTDPKVALVLDPWLLHRDGALSLVNPHPFQGRFEEAVPALYVRAAGEGGAEPAPESAEPHRYRPLKTEEIRILRVTPGTGDAPIHGRIEHVHIRQPGKYWAISYVWGLPDPARDQRHYVETAGGGRIKTTQSLDAVIRTLREESEGPLCLWVDAVSINQRDHQEKAQQIRKMGKIFSKAERVIAWLGDEADGSHEALEALAKMQTPGGGGGGSLCRAVPSDDDPIWRKINALVRRPWFRRAWVTQELVLSSKVVLRCGRRSAMDWDAFFGALEVCEQGPADGGFLSGFLSDAGSALALGTTRRRWRPECPYGLLELLELFSHTRATIEADKLFSLLGLARNGTNRFFRPDYDSAFEDVVWNYAAGLIDCDQGMHLLSLAGGKKSYDFSSWVPRLTRGDFPATISTWNAGAGRFRAGPPISPSFVIGGDSSKKHLRVQGYAIDTVWRTTTVFIIQRDCLYVSEALRTFRRLLEPFRDGLYQDSESLEDLLFRVPIGDARAPCVDASPVCLRGRNDRPPLGDQNGDGSSGQAATWPPNLRQLVLGRSELDPERDVEALSEPDKEAWVLYWQTAAAFSRRLGNAVFCETDKGFVGLAPEDTKAGDKICLLHDAKAPFLLRRRPGVAPTWSLIGEGYIHGIMYGEGVPSGPAEDFSLV